MKKWPILAAALLLAFAGAFKVLRHNAGSAAPSPAQQDLVSLPNGEKLYVIPGEFSAVPARTAPPTTYGALPTIKDKAYDTGPCKGGSLNEIFSAHGRIWGELARHGSFRNTETAEVYDLLGRYLACMGLARGEPAFCDYLPAGSLGEKAEARRSNSPNYKCREFYANAVTKAGSAEGCPADYGALCSAFVSRSEASCSALLAKLGSSYCACLADAQKRAGGYAGYSPEELQAAFKRDEAVKAAEERLRLENAKITEEINQRVRKLMGKQAAPASK